MTTTTPNEPARIHIRVTGRVQGVGFRAFVMQAGTLFGLTGWVRNVGYDQVETVAEGRREVLLRFLESVKTGPRPSRVDEAQVDWETPTGEFKHFGMDLEFLLRREPKWQGIMKGILFQPGDIVKHGDAAEKENG